MEGLLVPPPRSVALIGAVCVMVGWLLASTLTPPVARVQTRAERRPDAAVARPALAPLTERLHARRQQVSAPSTPRRNPFVFGARRSIPAAGGAALEPPVPVAEMPSIALPARPVFELSGIGVSGAVRTAVLSDGTSVVVAKVGDLVGGYTVGEITDASVTLTALSGERHVLRLR